MVLDRCVNENLMILCSIACTYMYAQVKNKSHVLYFPQISGRYWFISWKLYCGTFWRS